MEGLFGKVISENGAWFALVVLLLGMVYYLIKELLEKTRDDTERLALLTQMGKNLEGIVNIQTQIGKDMAVMADRDRRGRK